jgi:hypothetical protein
VINLALALYKTYVRERLVYQDLNGSFETITNYINDYCQLQADCVSANTASKVVKRDASGNFAANTITANSFVGPVTGDVTGDLKSGSTIDGQALLNVFEEDTANAGKILPKVKEASAADTATLADAATNATKLNNQSWVELLNSSVSIASGSSAHIQISADRNEIILASVSSGASAGNPISITEGCTPAGAESVGSSYWVISREDNFLGGWGSFLHIYNNSDVTHTFNYKVLAWR